MSNDYQRKLDAIAEKQHEVSRSQMVEVLVVDYKTFIAQPKLGLTLSGVDQFGKPVKHDV